MVPIEKLVLLYVLLFLHLKTKVLLGKTNFSIGMDGRLLVKPMFPILKPMFAIVFFYVFRWFYSIFVVFD